MIRTRINLNASITAMYFQVGQFCVSNQESLVVIHFVIYSDGAFKDSIKQKRQVYVIIKYSAVCCEKASGSFSVNKIMLGGLWSL